MEQIHWDDSIYSVGITHIDQQHQKLIKLINAIIINREKSADKEFINKIFNTLIEYTKMHFRDEEQIMKNIKFDRYDSHKGQHDKFEDKVKEFMDLFHQENDSELIMDQILLFLKKWLTQHILIEDRAYRDYFLKGIHKG